jgi:hypothetical protein
MNGTVTQVREARRRGGAQSGAELIEFSLVALFLIPMLFLSFTTGMNLVRGNQCTQLARDLGSMYIHGVDFSLDASKNLAVRLARGMNLQNSSTSGDGLIILSQITFIGDYTCTANGLVGAACTNRNQYVFTQRLTIGNTTLLASRLGTPTATIDSRGFVQNYLTDSGARVASMFSSLWNPQLTDGQYVYAVEAYFKGLSLNLAAFPSGGVYSRHFF